MDSFLLAQSLSCRVPLGGGTPGRDQCTEHLFTGEVVVSVPAVIVVMKPQKVITQGDEWPAG